MSLRSECPSVMGTIFGQFQFCKEMMLAGKGIIYFYHFFFFSLMAGCEGVFSFVRQSVS